VAAHFGFAPSRRYWAGQRLLTAITAHFGDMLIFITRAADAALAFDEVKARMPALADALDGPD